MYFAGSHIRFTAGQRVGGTHPTSHSQKVTEPQIQVNRWQCASSSNHAASLIDHHLTCLQRFYTQIQITYQMQKESILIKTVYWKCGITINHIINCICYSQVILSNQLLLYNGPHTTHDILFIVYNLILRTVFVQKVFIM